MHSGAHSIIKLFSSNTFTDSLAYDMRISITVVITPLQYPQFNACIFSLHVIVMTKRTLRRAYCTPAFNMLTSSLTVSQHCHTFGNDRIICAM